MSGVEIFFRFSALSKVMRNYLIRPSVLCCNLRHVMKMQRPTLADNGHKLQNSKKRRAAEKKNRMIIFHCMLGGHLAVSELPACCVHFFTVILLTSRVSYYRFRMRCDTFCLSCLILLFKAFFF